MHTKCLDTTKKIPASLLARQSFSTPSCPPSHYGKRFGFYHAAGSALPFLVDSHVASWLLAPSLKNHQLSADYCSAHVRIENNRIAGI